MSSEFYIKEEKSKTYTIASIETMQPVTVDMSMAEAVTFLNKMLAIKSRSLRPDEPRLFYNRASN